MIALFFDTETTGVKSWKDPDFIPRLVQLGAILQDLDSGRVLAEINLMVIPEDVEIPEGATAVHGISTTMAIQFGLSMDPVDELFESLLLMADILVAHNTPYDLEVMADNLKRSNDIFRETELASFDTMAAARDVVKAPLTQKQLAYFKDRPDLKDGDYKSPNLTETYKHFFGVPFEGAHDAMADIRACRDIYLELKKLNLTPGGLMLDGGEELPF